MFQKHHLRKKRWQIQGEGQILVQHLNPILNPAKSISKIQKINLPNTNNVTQSCNLVSEQIECYP